ncbi:MAG: hypothetical protein AAB225_00230 [Acidobacteriota bacterium]
MRGDERFFVDTNALLYAADPGDPTKRQAARLWLDALWEHGAGRLSWQVLHEFYVNAVRRLEMPAPPSAAVARGCSARTSRPDASWVRSPWSIRFAPAPRNWGSSLGGAGGEGLEPD